jgi:DNA-binding CsgD family transcriptional regulator
MAQAAAHLEAARAAYDRCDWVAARAAFRAVHERGGLDPDDVAAFADCAWWLGDLDEAIPLHQQAYRRFLEVGAPARAALTALELGYTLQLRGDTAQASGWMRRADQLLDALPEGVEHGYRHHLAFENALVAVDLDTAAEQAAAVAALGERFGDPTLAALGALGRGRVLVRQGQVTEGVALLDVAMVAAVTDQLPPAWAGDIYCHLMFACAEIADLRRAGEWTEVTARWCERMPGAGPFMGICRVHRAALLQVRGSWDAAERELALVRSDGGSFEVSVTAEAHYQHGELRRLRGDLAGAERAYRTAHQLGRDPQPGMALLALARGRTVEAAAAIRSALTAAGDDPVSRARSLPAAVEIALAGAEPELADEAATELEQLAEVFGTTGFAAAAATARGRVAAATGQHERALPVLLEALRGWQLLGAPFEVVRLRQLLAITYGALGDPDSARLEREATVAGCEQLGIRPPEPPRPARSDRLDALTPREAEILALVAEGRSNQQIAATLVLSVRTVERHLATVYRKLGLHGRSARAAAVSYALREGLLAPS